jgi:hypothetical protein
LLQNVLPIRPETIARSGENGCLAHHSLGLLRI